MKQPSATLLQKREDKLKLRVEQYGLEDIEYENKLFDETQYQFVEPIEAAERLLILLAVSFTAYNFDESEKVMDWLKKEELWKSVSPQEKEFFRNPDPGNEEKQNLSWRFEGGYILAWALKKVSTTPDPGSECDEKRVSEFLQSVPPVGSSTEAFFAGLKFRRLPDIIEEALFYEIATKYFKTIIIEDKENSSQVHSKASVQRYLALKWLKNAKEKLDWDENVTGD
ncbi:MAG: DUF4272 domain-containing protein [Flavitalea sp.]